MVVAETGGEELPDRDLTDKEWCVQYVDTKKKVVLYTAKKKGDGQLERYVHHLCMGVVYAWTMKIQIQSTLLL